MIVIPALVVVVLGSSINHWQKSSFDKEVNNLKIIPLTFVCLIDRCQFAYVKVCSTLNTVEIKIIKILYVSKNLIVCMW